MKKSKIKIKLSQCMIVKNEEKNIRRALSWGKGIVSEQIVVDTGSTDRTVEIAEEMGARVYHFQWIDDFSAAKNYAIEQATGNWIAFLDADEYFTEESVKKLMPIIQKAEEMNRSGRKARIIRAGLANVDGNGKMGVLAHQDRVFRNEADLRYKNRIHEVLALPDGRMCECLDEQKDLMIIHTGYTKEAYARTGKTERNVRMLEKEMDSGRKNAAMLAYLGDSMMTQSRFDEAKECFRQAVLYGTEREGEELGEEEKRAAFRAVLMLIVLYARKPDPEDGETVRELHRKYREMNSSHPDGDGYFGAWLYQNRKYAEAEGYLESALDKFKWYKGDIPVYMSANLKLLYAQLADCCRHLDKKEEAVRYSVMSLGADRYFTEPLLMLLNLMKKEEGEPETASGTWNILSQLYNVSSLKDQMTILKGAKLTAFAALEKRVFAAMPEGQRKAVREALHKKAEEMRAHAKSTEKPD